MFEAERIERLAGLLRKTSEAHAQEFAEAEGADSDWPRWFAARLEDSLTEILGRELDPGRIALLLAEAEEEHLITSPGRDWTVYYAEFLIARVM